MIKVTLDLRQGHKAIQKGVERAKSYKPQFDGVTLKKNYDLELNGGDFSEFTVKQINAAGAESAVGEYLGYLNFEPHNGAFKDIADVGENVEVKHTHRHTGNLIITYLDRDDDIAVLVRGHMPTYTLVGWMDVAQCKNEGYRSELLQGDSYLIPWQDLNSMQTLKIKDGRAYGYAQV